MLGHEYRDRDEINHDTVNAGTRFMQLLSEGAVFTRHTSRGFVFSGSSSSSRKYVRFHFNNKDIVSQGGLLWWSKGNLHNGEKGAQKEREKVFDEKQIDADHSIVIDSINDTSIKLIRELSVEGPTRKGLDKELCFVVKGPVSTDGGELSIAGVEWWRRFV